MIVLPMYLLNLTRNLSPAWKSKYRFPESNMEQGTDQVKVAAYWQTPQLLDGCSIIVRHRVVMGSLWIRDELFIWCELNWVVVWFAYSSGGRQNGEVKWKTQ
jgi:hypothetical protein